MSLTRFFSAAEGIAHRELEEAPWVPASRGHGGGPGESRYRPGHRLHPEPVALLQEALSGAAMWLRDEEAPQALHILNRWLGMSLTAAKVPVLLRECAIRAHAIEGDRTETEPPNAGVTFTVGRCPHA